MSGSECVPAGSEPACGDEPERGWRPGVHAEGDLPSVAEVEELVSGGIVDCGGTHDESLEVLRVEA
jgi:hypothetical protein